MSVGVVLEMFWMSGDWVHVVDNHVVPPTDALFVNARTRVVEDDPTTGATVENPRTTAVLT